MSFDPDTYIAQYPETFERISSAFMTQVVGPFAQLQRLQDPSAAKHPDALRADLARILGTTSLMEMQSELTTDQRSRTMLFNEAVSQLIRDGDPILAEFNRTARIAIPPIEDANRNQVMKGLVFCVMRCLSQVP